MNLKLCIAGAVLALAGCKTQVATTIYTSDVLAALEGGEAITTPMEIALETHGDKGCSEMEQPVAKALADAYGAADYIGCDKRNFDTYAVFRVPVEIVHELSNKESDSNQPIYIGVYPSNDGTKATAHFFRNQEQMKAFYNSLPDDLTRFQSSEPSLSLTATLANDLRDDVVIEVNDVFADGKPIQKRQPYNLARRGEVKIELSNVSNEAFTTGSVISVLIADMPLPAQ